MPHAISIHAPPRGATFTRAVFVVTSDIFQFTPLREGRLDQLYQGETGGISIHAPPRGATRPALRCSEKSLFQFTPLREGRLLHRVEIHLRRAFQFTPLREGRPRLWKKTSSATFHFNSRPSARGDRNLAWLSICPVRFQFTPLREGRPPAPASWTASPTFQFTPLREGRPAPCKGRLRGSYFNSRPSARGDPHPSDIDARPPISIHAPPRGATSCWTKRAANCKPISIHAPPRGATKRATPTPTRWTPFQFTPLREGRPNFSRENIANLLFQFTPLREGRLSINLNIKEWSVISIHAPPRGATAKDMQFLQIFCSTLTNQHGLTIVPRNLSRLFW